MNFLDRGFRMLSYYRQTDRQPDRSDRKHVPRRFTSGKW